jgi:Zn-dependent peptidase ImmA (M78 family)/transcriptional regulator with XRE-family HTH domain
MTIGVAGFIGERLTEAREARGLMTMTSLADLLGVSTNAVSQYENNFCKPRHEMVLEMAKKLKLKEAFFFKPIENRIQNPVFWRSRHAATKASRVVAKRRLAWIKAITDDYLKHYLELPTLALPAQKDLGTPSDPKKLSDEKIEQIAVRCREFWGLGTMPIQDLTAFLENHGLLVTCGELDSEKLDAFSNVSEHDRSFHIFLGIGRSAVRSRFDAAHELGHLILHSHLPREYLEDKDKTKKHRLIEHQAFRFASAFLMPAESFGGDVWMTALDPLLSLKERWRVSVGAMIKRCDDLGMLDESHARRLWITYNRRWRKLEPLDDSIPFETPQLMKRCFDLLVESKIKSKAEILHDLPYSQHDIETLMNLPESYLDDNFGEVRQLPSIRPRVASGDGGKVIKFDTRKPSQNL